MPPIRRLFVEKKPEFAVEARHILHDLKENLGIAALENLRLIVRYDVEGLGDAEFEAARWTVFAEPPVDALFDEELPLAGDERALAVEYLPGQYDQRADSAAQCLQLLSHGLRPTVACARVYVLKGSLDLETVAKVRGYLVNPVDSREATAAKPTTLNPALPEPEEVKVMVGFNGADEALLLELQGQLGMAMTLADLKHTQAYFRDEEHREPTETELRLLDTYWSDHCRHTTFLTELEKVTIEDGPFSGPIAKAFLDYRNLRRQVFGERISEKPECLMDIALLPMRVMRQAGKLDDQEQTSEINACSVVVDIDNTAAPEGHEEWLLMFKNETHNHPTEIEPFGGAATCLGGAIRDPLSGRAYVYHSMRVTGSGDPRVPVKDTLAGKLPQRKITTEAAAGFASYGNQIGLCTGQVQEYYDAGYVAKRMERSVPWWGPCPVPRCAARSPSLVTRSSWWAAVPVVMASAAPPAAPRPTPRRVSRAAGLRSRRATPPMERKLQRLFRKPEFSRLVKKCNDFGAGGVSVAIGELADGLVIDLDVVPKKYEGLNGTELAIAESQERMALVVEPKDVEAVLALAAQENLEAVVVAEVTEEKRLRMSWRGKPVADLSRAFLDTNGAPQGTQARIATPGSSSPFKARKVEASGLAQQWLASLADINTCSQRGLVEKFDSTIGAASVLVPFGGRTRRTPAESMVAKFPVLGGETRSASAMSHGFLPEVAKWSPFHGAVWAHVVAAARLVAVGADPSRLRYTLQEYFGKPAGDPLRWGAPLAALLGAPPGRAGIGDSCHWWQGQHVRHLQGSGRASHPGGLCRGCGQGRPGHQPRIQGR